jgi:hypothetical protein
MNEIVESMPQERRIATQSATTPSDLLRMAVEQGADINKLEQLMALQERWEANQARKCYVEAMSEFKKSPPQIFKTKEVGFTTKSGEFTGYKHATLGDVTSSIVEGLANHGFSHRWNTEQKDGGQIVVTCILTHKLGHSENTALSSGRDDSGKKNNIQAMASAITYLQRYTLLAATGLATQDEDDDGAGYPSREPEGEPEKKEYIKPTINGVRFAAGIEKIKAGEFTAERMRKAYALTVDQETALDDAVSELK